jgi:O-antigen/teichoic acid export membrane protein
VLSSRIYGVNVIGQYALAVGLVAYVRLVSNAKERPALVRELATLAPRVPRISGLFFSTLTFSVALTWLTSGIALLATQFLLNGPVSQPGLFLPLAVNVAGYALFGNTSENLELVPQVFRAGRLLFVVRFTDGIVFLAIAVPLGLAHATVWGLIIASVGAQLFGMAHRAIRIRPFMRFGASRQVLADGFRTLPSVLRFGIKIVPGFLADGAANESATWLVASFNPIAAVGAFGRGYLVVKQLMVAGYVQEMLFPTLVERRATGDGRGHARALVDSLRYATVGLLLFAAAAGGAAHGIMRVFGPGFEKGADALSVLLLVPSLYMASQLMRIALVSDDRPWRTTIAGILRLVVTLSAAAVLAWKFGGLGAACGLVIGFVADLAFCSWIFLRHLDTPFFELWPLRQLLVIPVAYAAGFVSALVVDLSLAWPLGMFGGGALGCVVYAATLWLGGAFNERDKERYRDIRRKIAERRSPVPRPMVVTTRRYSEPIYRPAYDIGPLFAPGRRNGSAVSDRGSSQNERVGVEADEPQNA